MVRKVVLLWWTLTLILLQQKSMHYYLHTYMYWIPRRKTKCIQVIEQKYCWIFYWWPAPCTRTHAHTHVHTGWQRKEWVIGARKMSDVIELIGITTVTWRLYFLSVSLTVNNAKLISFIDIFIAIWLLQWFSLYWLVTRLRSCCGLYQKKTNFT